jgi:2-amino-4-hydroxy-6-hydroxymethyldihydropteridine diphosphokinase
MSAAERVFVGLGANLGDARQTVEAALAALGALPGTACVARSALYASAPVDAGGPDYVNAVAELRTTLEPEALLAHLQTIELQHGRERPYTNAPRTLDLDLLLHGGRCLHTAFLTLPHPRLHQRAFVLLPLAQLAPTLQVPGVGDVQTLLPAVSGQAIHRIDG